MGVDGRRRRLVSQMRVGVGESGGRRERFGGRTARAFVRFRLPCTALVGWSGLPKGGAGLPLPSLLVWALSRLDALGLTSLIAGYIASCCLDKVTTARQPFRARPSLFHIWVLPEQI